MPRAANAARASARAWGPPNEASKTYRRTQVRRSDHVVRPQVGQRIDERGLPPGVRVRQLEAGRTSFPHVPDGFCKLIADRQTHTILSAHVLGEYSAETVQTVAACMAAGMTIEQVAELQLAFPTFTEAICMAAQKICRTLGIGRFPQAWSYLGPED